MQRALILASGELVGIDDLHLSGDVLHTADAPPEDARQVAPTPVGRAADDALPAAPGERGDSLRERERAHILETLAASGGSRKLAGERLGMPERTLRHKLRKYREEGFLKD